MIQEKKIAIIGLGYVGLPLAIEFSKKFNVIGFDILSERISSLLEGVDSTNEIEPSMLNSSNLVLTDNEENNPMWTLNRRLGFVQIFSGSMYRGAQPKVVVQ